MHTTRFAVLSSLVLMLAACASQQSTSSKAAATQPGGQPVKSRDGTFTGEVVGTAAPGSKFARLQIGMQMKEVQDILGRAPDRLHTYESGKRWIPFYFGNDVRRMQVLFSGEGCLVFSDGNVWGAAGGDLIAIHHDATGRCYQP
ncbi:MAG TPA: hypothetical protein VEZ89_03720 [Rubrivivax sp.]|nr:hypothetical protein [Rubrivivax sp.]